MSAVPKTTMIIAHIMIDMANHISIALARLALFGLVFRLKAHTKNIIIFTTGITETSRVISQSLTETTSVELFSGVSILCWLSIILMKSVESNIRNYLSGKVSCKFKLI